MSNPRALQHKLNILKLLYDTGMRITASQLSISNANQYFIPLEEMKLIKRVSIQRENSTPYKVGFIDTQTKEKAKEYLKKHNKLNTETPFQILNLKNED